MALWRQLSLLVVHRGGRLRDGRGCIYAGVDFLLSLMVTSVNLFSIKDLQTSKHTMKSPFEKLAGAKPTMTQIGKTHKTTVPYRDADHAMILRTAVGDPGMRILIIITLGVTTLPV